MFTDRAHAGKALADALAYRGIENPLVLAAPRGGVPVGAEIARRLRCDLDVVLVRKLRHPLQPELAIGAVGEDGAIALNADIARTVHPEQLQAEIDHQRAEIERRAAVYRAVKPPVDVRGRNVILVDDGVATGATMQAAIEVARQQGAARTVVALPVAPPDTRDALAREADEIVCLLTPPSFRAVALYYDDFPQLSDDDVVATLRDFAPPSPS